MTLYATLGDDAIIHGINETEVSIVVTTQDLLPKFRQLLKDCPSVETLVYIQDQLRATEDVTAGMPKDVRIVSFNDVVSSGSQAANQIGK